MIAKRTNSGAAVDFPIVEHGAVGDGKTMNTAAIQAAIDACHEAGGGRVVCGPGDYLTGTLTLRSHVELFLAAGCRLVGSTDLADYEDFTVPGFLPDHAPEKSTKSLIKAAGAEDIAITGPGEIDGSGLAFYDVASGEGRRFFRKPETERPRMVMFHRCRHVRLADAGFIDSPCWTMWLMQCEEVAIRGVRVRGDQRMINNDGIDLDACRNVTVSDSTFKTADDCLILRSIQKMFDTPAVCENVSVSNCVLDSWCQGVRVGCPGDAVIRNCTFSNLVIDSLNNGILFENPKRYLPAGNNGSADVHDILFDNVVVNCGANPIKVVVEEGITLQRLSGLGFANFRIKSGGPCVVQGCRETVIRDVSFSNVRIETTGDDAIVCRHCENVRLDNVALANRPAGKAR